VLLLLLTVSLLFPVLSCLLLLLVLLVLVLVLLRLPPPSPSFVLLLPPPSSSSSFFFLLLLFLSLFILLSDMTIVLRVQTGDTSPKPANMARAAVVKHVVRQGTPFPNDSCHVFMCSWHRLTFFFCHYSSLTLTFFAYSSLRSQVLENMQSLAVTFATKYPLQPRQTISVALLVVFPCSVV